MEDEWRGSSSSVYGAWKYTLDEEEEGLPEREVEGPAESRYERKRSVRERVWPKWIDVLEAA